MNTIVITVAIAIFVIIIVVFSLLYNPSSAQKDVTKFLGIPIDGSPYEMAEKLMAKGFKERNGFLFGNLNGDDVQIIINYSKKKKKVKAITVAYECEVDEKEIIDKYNKIFDQFSNDKDYIIFDGQKIPENEKLSNIKENYVARFLQKSEYDKNNSNLARRLIILSVVDMFEKETGKCHIAAFYNNMSDSPRKRSEKI